LTFSFSVIYRELTMNYICYSSLWG